MSTIKSHNLKIYGDSSELDLERKVYSCVSYVPDNDVADLCRAADLALARGDLSTAYENYSLMLEKDPHDFRALKGRLLCDCKWNSLRPVLHMSKVSLNEDTPSLKYVLDNCLPEHKEYFTGIVDLIRLISDYRQKKIELKALEVDRASEIKIRHSLYELQKENNTRFSHKVERMRSYKTIKGYPLLDIVVILLLLTIAVSTALIGWYVLVAAVSLPLIYAAAYNIRKASADRSLEEEIRPHTEEIERLEAEVNTKFKESEKIKEDYMRRAKALITLDIELTGETK